MQKCQLRFRIETSLNLSISLIDLNNSMYLFSLLCSLASHVEIFEEFTFLFINDLLAIWETFISLYHVSTNRSDLIKYDAAPNVSLLDVVQSFIASGYEVIDGLNVAYLTMLSPVASKLKFSHLRICVLSVAEEVNDERHVSAIFSE